MKKIIFICFLSFIILCNVLDFTFWDSLKSYAFMYLYDKTQNTLHKKGINFYIPGGLKTRKKDWYPLMLHYDASKYFSQYIKKDVSLYILYSFGAFDFFKGSSNFYNHASPYYASFYGGYAVFCNDSDRPYGFDKKGNINIEEIKKVPMFDQTHLVLPSVGCPKDKVFFETTVQKIAYNQTYIGMNGWTKIDAIIKSNAPIHKKSSIKNTGYIQYGKPHKNFYKGYEYPLISLKGRIYVKYIDAFKGTFFLYIMAKDQKTVDLCDIQLLSKAYILKLKNTP
ncbi:hypothetical protein FQB35_00885 [Crassaminicella thermophila]|uniref:Uncharacterized protein n=1 Tax=Crassaminicella thermophila TaxID=2599308 RepID=A0A5C0SA76_CRATE|nr:hypothetical protein [Crassaminicella thermophila]QEK11041.1 hypothetical protein FQB35_00885 [Crassaminicella thermophila]